MSCLRKCLCIPRSWRYFSMRLYCLPFAFSSAATWNLLLCLVWGRYQSSVFPSCEYPVDPAPYIHKIALCATFVRNKVMCAVDLFVYLYDNSILLKFPFHWVQDDNLKCKAPRDGFGTLTILSGSIPNDKSVLSVISTLGCTASFCIQMYFVWPRMCATWLSGKHMTFQENKFPYVGIYTTWNWNLKKEIFILK